MGRAGGRGGRGGHFMHKIPCQFVVDRSNACLKELVIDK